MHSPGVTFGLDSETKVLKKKKSDQMSVTDF